MTNMQCLMDGLYADYYYRLNKFNEGNFCLAHFTRANIALDILTKREIWLNNVVYMNDYNEMTTGMNLVSDVINDYPWKQSFRDALENIHSGLSNEVITILNCIKKRYCKQANINKNDGAVEKKSNVPVA